METAWNNVKIDLITLIECLPTLLEKNGDYRYFGTECDSTPFIVSRVRIGGRDCWIICDSAEDSVAYTMECSKTTEGYKEDALEWFNDMWGIAPEDDIWISNQLYNN